MSQLCKAVGGCVNVSGVGGQLASGGCYGGLVDLALSVAGQRDTDGRALHYYKSGQPHTDVRGYAAFSARWGGLGVWYCGVKDTSLVRSLALGRPCLGPY